MRFRALKNKQQVLNEERGLTPIQNVSGYRVQELFDPVQTHGVYGVPDYGVNSVVAEAKERYGATCFRIVKVTNSNLRIVCFKRKR